MVNDIDQQERIFVVQQDYYYRMVNARKRIYREEHQETNKRMNMSFDRRESLFFLLPKHRLLQVNMEDIGIIPEQHN